MDRWIARISAFEQLGRNATRPGRDGLKVAGGAELATARIGNPI